MSSTGGSRRTCYYIGRALERHFGVLFFHVEPLWMSYYAECEAAGRRPSTPEGINPVRPRIAEALGTHEHVCVETTGASPEILNDLLSLQHPSKTLVARGVGAARAMPRTDCLPRSADQIPMDVESIRTVHALSSAARVKPDLTLENVRLTEAEVVATFATP